LDDVGLLDAVRGSCRALAEEARWVRIDPDGVDRAVAEWSVEAPAQQGLDPVRHFLEGSREEVATYFLTLGAINFGSGWFPTLRKRPGCSGYFTVAWSLAERFRGAGPWTAGELRAMKAEWIATVLDQDPDHELMALYAEALRQLGLFLGTRTATELVDAADRSAQRLAGMLRTMPFFDDTGFWKRAQITANDLALAGVADFTDRDRLTIFADNLVPHVLRVDGVLDYNESLSAQIDAGNLLPPGGPERELRACAVHACELIAARCSIPPHVLDVWLWNRGQDPHYKSRPRHRTRTVYY
jgi:putative queuosine salvage protein